MILVTGGTGHIGSALVRRLLRRGRRVRVLIQRGQSPLPLRGLPVQFVEGDVLDISSLRRAMDGIQTIFHLAGVISILPGLNPTLRKINVQGTNNVLQAAREEGVQRLVYTSSIHALRRKPSGLIDESVPYDPDNPYGEYDRSKADATLQVWRAAQEGLDAVIACPTGVIGPYDFGGSLMGRVIEAAARQKPMLYVDGAYDFVDVRDCAAGLEGAAEWGRSGESYILSGHRISVRYLLETVRELTGGRFFQVRVPLKLAQFFALFTPLYYRLLDAAPRFTPYSLAVLQSNCNISHQKASRELGYHPRSVYQTVSDTIRWFLDAAGRSTAGDARSL